MDRFQLLRNVQEMLEGRQATHGDALLQPARSQEIKSAIGHRTCPQLSAGEREAIDMIALKLSRLVMGTPSIETWKDIVGYGAIGLEARARVDSFRIAEEATD